MMVDFQTMSPGICHPEVLRRISTARDPSEYLRMTVALAPRLHDSRAFTVIETMIAVIILAILASAVTLSFNGPLHRARGVEAVELIKYLDASSRDFARRFGDCL